VLNFVFAWSRADIVLDKASQACAEARVLLLAGYEVALEAKACVYGEEKEIDKSESITAR
jgi:hypothetical protein